MVAVPAEIPDTTALLPAPLTVAMAVLLLTHTPPSSELERVSVAPGQKGAFPDIGPGVVLTVTDRVEEQPVESV